MSEESEEKTPAPQNETVKKLLNAFLQFYTTEATGDPELKTTLELVEEMAPVADVGKWEIQLALQRAGFEIKYSDAGPFWVLYRKTTLQA